MTREVANAGYADTDIVRTTPVRVGTSIFMGATMEVHDERGPKHITFIHRTRDFTNGPMLEVFN